jgi:hypothetical protein
MFKRRTGVLLLLSCGSIAFSGVFSGLYAAWNSQNTNGNPVVPGYFADPSILYDSTSQTFYIYSTTDGVWISYSGEPQVWYSSDFVNWKCQAMTLPVAWPTTQLWAPSAMRHPTNGRYYLMYCSNSAVLASSESAYKGGTSGNISETFASITGFYVDNYAVDRNFGTRWAPATLPGYLIVDLGADYSVGRCETMFEYVMRWYRYRIQYLAASEAANITAAQASTAWHMFADRSSNSLFPSPMVDTGHVTARYMRITVLSANLPPSSQTNTIVETDYADRVSVVEFKVFQLSIPVSVALREERVFHSLPRNGTIACVLEKAGTVSLRVVDIAGRTVHRREFPAPAGEFTVTTDGLPLVPGTYFGMLNVTGGTRSEVVRFVK